MKILLLAYACEPGKGSEPGVGWQWAVHLAADSSKEVHVLTRSNNKNVIDSFTKSKGLSPNLHFYYYDLPAWLVYLKKKGLPVNIYYALWLQGASAYAKEIHEEVHFDFAHHITFGVFRDASFLYRLGVPYVIGPVGGAEMTPKSLMDIYSSPDVRKEKLRYIYNKVSLWNPFLRKTFNRASLILSKTQATKRFIGRWHDKTNVRLEIGINDCDKDEESIFRVPHHFLYAGRFIHWKGVTLALEAFRIYVAKYPHAQLTLIGKGTLRKDLENYIKAERLENNVRIIEWMRQEELFRFYKSANAFVFPSLHDSSGNVVLEAMSKGLPVICLDNAGPAEVLGQRLKLLTIPTLNRTKQEVLDDIVRSMERLAVDENYFKDVQQLCYNRAEELLWKNTVANSYQLIIDKIFCKKDEVF